MIVSFQLTHFLVQSVLCRLLFLQELQALNVLKLQSSHLVLCLSNIKAGLIHHVLELDGYFGSVEIGVSFFDVGPVIVGVRQGHRGFEVGCLKVYIDIVVSVIMDLVVAVVYFLAWTVSHLSYLLHVLTQRVYKLSKLVLEFLQSLNGKPFSIVISLHGFLDEGWANCLILEDFDLCL